MGRIGSEYHTGFPGFAFGSGVSWLAAALSELQERIHGSGLFREPGAT
jgi:hypothetical protein